MRRTLETGYHHLWCLTEYYLHKVLYRKKLARDTGAGLITPSENQNLRPNPTLVIRIQGFEGLTTRRSLGVEGNFLNDVSIENLIDSRKSYDMN